MNALKGNVGNSVEAPKGSIDIENILLPTKRSISLCPLTKAPFMYNLKGFDKNFFYSFLDFLKILDYVSRSEKVPKEISDELSN
ncbi:MAG: hypothetical protein LBC61_07925 [Candidatus Peribacteria bacterium]|jgi:hypothetical protein|nr:hypothetical protein [Candidatus Peribacteria bacterium]